MRILITSLSAAILIGLLPSTVQAQTPRDVNDLVGVRASGGETQLRDRGYVYIDASRAADRSYTMWWNPQTSTCITVATMDGRYHSIMDSPAADCNQYHVEGHNHTSTGEAVAGAAVAIGAIALIGALTHRSHHHEDESHSDDEEYEREYERGHRDGLYHRSYDRHNDTPGYIAGYRSGAEQRDHDTSYRYHSGTNNPHGYRAAHSANELNRLSGERASSVDSQLLEWGFRDVDNGTTANTRYAIWYNRSTGQCIRVVMADGRASRLADLRTHPSCH